MWLLPRKKLFYEPIQLDIYTYILYDNITIYHTYTLDLFNIAMENGP